MKPIQAILLLLSAASLLPAAEKPNILFIYSDDQSYETIRALGRTDIDTPNLDRLTARGTTFTHAYNMGAWHGAICVASRTMLVTGRTVWRAKANEKNLDADVAAKRLWPQRMAAQGYETYFSGKWHISTDVAKAFGHVVNKRPGMPNDVAAGYNRPITGQPDLWNPSDPKFGGFWKGGKHWSEVLGDDSIAFIGQAAKSTPFSPPSGPTQWLFQSHPAESKLLAAKQTPSSFPDHSRPNIDPNFCDGSVSERMTPYLSHPSLYGVDLI